MPAIGKASVCGKQGCPVFITVNQASCDRVADLLKRIERPAVLTLPAVRNKLPAYRVLWIFRVYQTHKIVADEKRQ